MKSTIHGCRLTPVKDTITKTPNKCWCGYEESGLSYPAVLLCSPHEDKLSQRWKCLLSQQSLVDVCLGKLKSGSYRNTYILTAHCGVTHNRQVVESAKMLIGMSR